VRGYRALIDGNVVTVAFDEERGLPISATRTRFPDFAERLDFSELHVSVSSKTSFWVPSIHPDR